MQKFIKQDQLKLNIELHPSVRNLLSIQYLINYPQKINNLQQIIDLAIKGIQQNILKLKYGLNNQHILRYGIKNFKQQGLPFDQNELQFIQQIAKNCQIIINTRDYTTTTNCLNSLNLILHSQCHHKNLLSQKTQILAQNVGNKIKQQQDQLLQDKQIQLFEKQEENKNYQNKKLKVHLTNKFKQFNLNFKYLNLKQAIIFQSLIRCQIWFTICRQRRKNSKGFHLDPLVNTFYSIVKKIDISENPFHLSVLPRRNIQKMEQKKRVQKSKNPLFQAVNTRNYKQVRRLLLNGANIQALALGNQRVARQLRCAHQAVANNDVQMCKILTSFGVDWQSEDSQKMSPIFYAIQNRSLETLKYLVETVKVNIQKMQIQNRTPFYWASTQGQLQYIGYLYKKGANINHKSKLGRCPLSKACFLGRRDIVQYLLKCDQIDFRSQDEKGRSALHNATFGPKGGRQGQKFGTNSSDSPDCAQLLLQKGLQVDILDFQQNSSLHIAMSSQAIDSIRLLIAWGASMTIINNYGQTPIMTGSKFGHIQSVKVLYQQFNSPIFHKDIFGKNIILLIAKFRHYKQNTQNKFPDNGQIHQKIAYRQLYSSMNPVFLYMCDKYIYQMYSKWSEQNKKKNINYQTLQKNLKQLHYTFNQLLYNGVYEQFIYFTKKLIQNNVPFPKMTLNDAKFLLQIVNTLKNQDDKKVLLSILLNRNQQGLHVFQLQKDKIEDFLSWLLQKNDLKLLQFASQNQMLVFHHFNKTKNKQESYFCDLPMNILTKLIPLLKEKVISFCLLNLTFNWLKYTDQHTGQNIMHFLIRGRKVGTIIQLTKLLSGKKMDFVKNKYLKKFLQIEKQQQNKNQYNFLQSILNQQFFHLINQKDQGGITPYQLSHIIKQPSIIKILSERLKQVSLQGYQNQVLQKLDVKQYKIQRQTEKLQELKIFEMGYQLEKQFDQLIEKVNLCQNKQQLSEIIPILKQNSKILSQKINIDIDFINEWNNFKTRPIHFIKNQNQIKILKPLLNSNVVGVDVQYDFADGNETIICILQFSSLTQDYIIDMMACTFQNGQNKYISFIQKLKKQFFKPLAYNKNITILMHGSDHDLYILKSCFNISFINFLDSSRIDIDLKKNISIRGLATLTNQYLNVQMSKDLQVSQWRVRPLPLAMIQYARRDSMILPFLVRKMLMRFQKLQDLKETIINSFKHAKKNKKPNQPLIKKLIPI